MLLSDASLALSNRNTTTAAPLHVQLDTSTVPMLLTQTIHYKDHQRVEAKTNFCLVTLDLSVVLGFVFLIFDGKLNPIAREIHFILAGILASETEGKHQQLTN